MSKAVLYLIGMALKDRLREARERITPKLTQAALGEKLGVTSQAVSQWERGEDRPDIEKLPKIAAALESSVDWLLSDYAPKSTEKTLSFWPLFKAAEGLDGAERRRAYKLIRSALDLDEA